MVIVSGYVMAYLPVWGVVLSYNGCYMHVPYGTYACEGCGFMV